MSPRTPVIYIAHYMERIYYQTLNHITESDNKIVGPVKFDNVGKDIIEISLLVGV